MSADCVRQGPLYRGLLCSEKGRESKKLALWAGELYTKVTVKAGLTVLKHSTVLIVGWYIITKIKVVDQLN